MLAKLTSKNQLTLPKSVTDKLGPVQYFEVQLQAGQVLLTPVRIQRGDAVRAKLAELELDDAMIAQAIAVASKAARPAVKTASGAARGTSASAPAARTSSSKASTTSKARKGVTPARAKTASVTTSTRKASRKSA